LGLAILIITLALTGFIANKRGPKTGQVKWADLDALLFNHQNSQIHSTEAIDEKLMVFIAFNYMQI